jgi:hypothetical protein
VSGDDFVLVALAPDEDGIEQPVLLNARVNSPSVSESMSWRSWYGLSSSCSSGILVMPAPRLAFGFAWPARDASAFHSAIVAFASGPFRFADCLWTTEHRDYESFHSATTDGTQSRGAFSETCCAGKKV